MVLKIYYRLKTDDWPFYCYFIAWVLTLLSILLGVGLVFAYGIRYANSGYAKDK